MFELLFFLYVIKNYFVFKAKGVFCAASFFNILGSVGVYGTGNLFLGRDVRINSGVRFNPIGGDTKVIFSTQGRGSIHIGDNVGLSNCSMFSRAKISIGEGTIIGGGVKIYDTDFHSLSGSDRKSRDTDRSNCISEPVFVGRLVFIGAHSIILKGVSIGDEVVIGAGSVVTKSIPPREIWAGNPARKIRSCLN